MRLFLGLLVLVVAAALAVGVYLFRPLGPPDADTPPELLTLSAYAQHSYSRTVPGTPQDLRAWMEDNSLLDYLTATETVPAVSGNEPIEGDWDNPGAKRRVLLASGEYAVERVLLNTTEAFEYQVWNFTTPTARLVDHAYAVQTFRPVDGGTKMTWTYHMTPKIGILKGMIGDFLTNDFGPFMEQGMNAMLDDYEARR